MPKCWHLWPLALIEQYLSQTVHLINTHIVHVFENNTIAFDLLSVFFYLCAYLQRLLSVSDLFSDCYKDKFLVRTSLTVNVLFIKKIKIKTMM